MHRRPCIVLKPNIPVIARPHIGIVQSLECRCKKIVDCGIDADIFPCRSMPGLSSGIEIQPALATGRTHKFEVTGRQTDVLAPPGDRQASAAQGGPQPSGAIEGHEVPKSQYSRGEARSGVVRLSIGKRAIKYPIAVYHFPICLDWIAIETLPRAAIDEGAQFRKCGNPRFAAYDAIRGNERLFSQRATNHEKVH